MAHGRGGGSNSRGLVLLLITSGFFITGLLFDYMPMIIDDHIKRTVELATNDEILSYWSRPPVDVNSYYWLYEIANPDQFQMEGAKPQMRQVGPFHFVSRMEKRILSISPNKFRITYNSTRFMRLNSSHSADQLDRPLTVLNPIYTSILEGTRVNGRELDAQMRAVAYGSINKLTERYNESILARNVTARMVLIGRNMPIVEKLKKIAVTFGVEGKLPDMGSSNGKYGYISLINDTNTGPFEIYTGYQETARSLGELISFKGKRRLSIYDGKCNRLQASVGELRPMPVDPSRRLEMYQPNFCRIVHLEPTGEHKLREGQAISYIVSPDDFASSSTNPDNRCFCVNSSGPTSGLLANDPLDDNHCSLEGVIDLGPCSYSAPILLSMSNVQLDSRILNSLSSDFDPELLNGEVQELDVADDKSQIVVLKRVGIPIRADFTLTLIMRVVRDPAFKETANVPQVSYIPLVTVRETVTIPPRLAQIIINLESFISLTYHIKVVMYLSAIILLCWLSGHYYSQTASVEPDGSGGGGGAQSGGRGGGGRRSSQTNRRTTLQSGRGGSEGGGGGPGGRSQPAANSSSGPSPAQGNNPDNDAAAAGERGRRASGQLRSSNLASVDLGAGIANNKSPFGGAIHQQQQQKHLVSGATHLETVEEVQRRSSKAPAGGDSFSSERANSADSNRSLPPSRHTSRLGSLSPANSTELESESAPAPPADAGAGQLRRLKRNASGATVQPIQRQPQPARIFSKVDEMRGVAGANQTSVAPIAQQQGDASVPSGKQSDALGERATGSDTAADLGQASDADATQQHRASFLARKRRTNWFMNVYSNFVHMLNGLRNTINEAGQLEVGNSGGGGQHTNDYLRDRQLEMLAGKIDNWYTGRDLGPSPADQDDDDDGGQRSVAVVTNQPEAEQVGASGEVNASPPASAVGTQSGGDAVGRTHEKTNGTDEIEPPGASQKSAQKATQTRSDDRDEPTLASQKSQSQAGEAPRATESSSAEEVTGKTGSEPGPLGSAGSEHEQEPLSASAPPPPPAAAATTTAEPNSIERNGLELDAGGSAQERVAATATAAAAAQETKSNEAASLELGAQSSGGETKSAAPKQVETNEVAQATRNSGETAQSNSVSTSASFDSALDPSEVSNSSRDSKVTQVLAGPHAGASSVANQSSVDSSSERIDESAPSRGGRATRAPSEESGGRARESDAINKQATSFGTKNSSMSQLDDEDKQLKQEVSRANADGLEDARLDSRNGIKNKTDNGNGDKDKGVGQSPDTSVAAGQAAKGNLGRAEHVGGGEGDNSTGEGPIEELARSMAIAAAATSDSGASQSASSLNGLAVNTALYASLGNAPPRANGFSSRPPPSYYNSTTDSSMTFQLKQQNYAAAPTTAAAGHHQRARLGATNATGSSSAMAGAYGLQPAATVAVEVAANSNGLNGNNILNGKIISQQRQALASGSLSLAAAVAMPGGFNNQLSGTSPMASHHEQTTTGNHHQQQQQQQAVQPAGA